MPSPNRAACLETASANFPVAVLSQAGPGEAEADSARQAAGFSLDEIRNWWTPTRPPRTKCRSWEQYLATLVEHRKTLLLQKEDLEETLEALEALEALELAERECRSALDRKRI
ncbi:hypothetical protein GCM10007392_46470 [Saccharospirillum salsuginis]|uniref:Uncharacterized protein n=1 Tax=Saccharospirillum salsuginis TaxID=418750 RepID=A0A918KRZ2_9GAMM|nr:hypothetical protein GCM10007392_46470 [Saccharospirillum salsuginis]